jgi:hypothetical protein
MMLLTDINFVLLKWWTHEIFLVCSLFIHSSSLMIYKQNIFAQRGKFTLNSVILWGEFNSKVRFDEVNKSRWDELLRPRRCRPPRSQPTWHWPHLRNHPPLRCRHRRVSLSGVDHTAEWTPVAWHCRVSFSNQEIKIYQEIFKHIWNCFSTSLPCQMFF